MPSSELASDYWDNDTAEESLELPDVAGSYTIDMDVSVYLIHTYEGEEVVVHEGTLKPAVLAQINAYFGTNFGEE